MYWVWGSFAVGMATACVLTVALGTRWGVLACLGVLLAVAILRWPGDE